MCHNGYCKSNPCYDKNCGKGKCVLIDIYQSQCVCDEGYFVSDSGCVPMIESCSDSSECFYRNNEGVKYGSCVTGNKCFYECQNDDDCVNKDEYCENNADTNEYNICTSVNGCSDPEFYYDYYFHSCWHKCVSEISCEGGFICTSEGECVKPCETNEDCINYKWAKGPVCNTETKTCGN